MDRFKMALECDGWKRSVCCDAPIYEDTDICSECGEHTECQCVDCEDIENCSDKR